MEKNRDLSGLDAVYRFLVNHMTAARVNNVAGFADGPNYDNVPAGYHNKILRLCRNANVVNAGVHAQDTDLLNYVAPAALNAIATAGAAADNAAIDTMVTELKAKLSTLVVSDPKLRSIVSQAIDEHARIAKTRVGVPAVNFVSPNGKVQFNANAPPTIAQFFDEKDLARTILI
jgi:hypothetical protein